MSTCERTADNMCNMIYWMLSAAVKPEAGDYLRIDEKTKVQKKPMCKVKNNLSTKRKGFEKKGLSPKTFQKRLSIRKIITKNLFYNFNLYYSVPKIRRNFDDI